ncbi:tetratricopeptide repeat protein [Dyadobacter sp. NIV53]|uniref:tetratricopeptide repeat protein n=1 Tax=Dyadobacter sp. NIV53 TaxID=2861765 RepID=UPI001C86B5CB|nr:tetratricopeptide repeat protein [Dyadobacter sp. NIV53]
MRIFTLFLTLLAFAAHAQHDHSDHTKTQTGNHLNHIQACRRETKYIHNLPPPELMNGVGKSDLKIQTVSDSTQKYFSQGVALMHCFWDFEAYRSFKEAIRRDSTAIMPYWGLMESIVRFQSEDFKKDKELAIRKLKLLKSKANDHEKLYAEASILGDSLKENGAKEAMKKLEAIVHNYPDDIDAKLFLALAKMGGYDNDMNLNEGQLYSEYLLRDVLKTHPNNHAVQHYWIHLKENCCPEQAEEAAHVLASLAPESGHIVHMPGHIYYKLGDFKRAHDSFIASLKVDSTYMKKQNILEIDTWNYLHNIGYLLASCSEDGRYKEGLYYAEKLKNMPMDTARKKEYNSMFHYVILAPTEMQMRYGFWDRAITELQTIQNPDSVFGKKEMNEKAAMLLYASGMNALKKNNISAAKTFSAELDAFLFRNTNQADKVEVLEKIAVEYFNVMSLQLQGVIKSMDGQYTDAVRILETAQKKEIGLGYSEPPVYPHPLWISIADAHVRMKQYDKALSSYEKLLKQRPGSARAYQGLASIYMLKGDTSKAAEFESKFRETTKYGDAAVYKDLLAVEKPAKMKASNKVKN